MRNNIEMNLFARRTITSFLFSLETNDISTLSANWSANYKMIMKFKTNIYPIRQINDTCPTMDSDSRHMSKIRKNCDWNYTLLTHWTTLPYLTIQC